MGKRKIENIHHIVPSSRACDGFKINEHDNQIRMLISRHDGLHGLFGNRHPIEQLRIWLEINRSVMSKEVCDTIEKLILTEREKFYRLFMLK